MERASVYYVTIKRLDHYGCKGVPIKTPFERDGKIYRTLQMIDCQHRCAQVDITREDI